MGDEIRCGTCGATMGPSDAWCTRCGAARPAPALDEQSGHGASELSSEEPAPEEPVLTKAERRARRRARLRRASLVTGALGLLVAGGAGGWLLNEALEDEPDPLAPVQVAIDRPVISDDDGRDAGEGAPSLVGLSEDRARQVLFDSGIPGEGITVEEIPYAGESGLVVSQSPPPGSPVTEGIALKVSAATVVPDLIGQPIDGARRQLEDAGAVITVTRVFDPDAAENTVVSIEPGVGEPMPLDVAITVAAAPSSVFVSTLDPVDSECSTGDVTINAIDLPTSLVCGASTYDERTVDIVLNRRVNRFEATIGQSDRSELGATVRFVASLDGNVVLDESVPFGEARPISVSTTGGLRLTLSVIVVGDEDSPSVSAGWGSARLLGAPEDIDDLVAESQ